MCLWITVKAISCHSDFCVKNTSSKKTRMFFIILTYFFCSGYWNEKFVGHPYRSAFEPCKLEIESIFLAFRRTHDSIICTSKVLSYWKKLHRLRVTGDVVSKCCMSLGRSLSGNVGSGPPGLFSINVELWSLNVSYITQEKACLPSASCFCSFCFNFWHKGWFRYDKKIKQN